MDNLPIELLCKIMVFVAQKDNTESPGHSWGLVDSEDEDVNLYKDFAGYWLPIRHTPPRILGPLQLGLVCRLWKEVSEQTPLLWNRLAVNLDEVMDSDATAAKVTKDLSVRLALSRQAPLHILIVWDNWERLDPSRFKKIFHGVLSHSHRWRSLQMRLPSEHWPAMLQAPFPQLKHLSLTNLTFMPVQPKDRPSWKALTHLSLEGINVIDLNMDLSSVTHLRLVDSVLWFPWSGFTDATHLEHLILDNCGVDTRSNDGGPITCRNIKHFTYNATFPAPHIDIFRVFGFPTLEEFILTEDTTSNDGSAGPVSFLSSCRESLRRFILREDPYNTQPRPCAGIVNLLSHLPSAEYVELDFQYVGLSYFNALLQRLAIDTPIADQKPAAILPSLRSLQFNYPHGVSWPLLPDILRSRVKVDSASGVKPLQQFTVKNMSALDSDRLTLSVVYDLLDLHQFGLEICLYNKDNKRMFLEDLA